MQQKPHLKKEKIKTDIYLIVVVVVAVDVVVVMCYFFLLPNYFYKF